MKLGYCNTYKHTDELGVMCAYRGEPEIYRKKWCDGIATVCWESGVIVDREPIKQENKP